MTPEEFADNGIEHYAVPYCKDEVCNKYLWDKFFKAGCIYNAWGSEVGLLQLHLGGVLPSVVCANMGLLLNAGFKVPINPAHKLVSPVLDFRNENCIESDPDVITYHAQLERITYKSLDGVGCADQSGLEFITELPGYYDIWLQIVVGWDNKETLIKEQLEWRARSSEK